MNDYQPFEPVILKAGDRRRVTRRPLPDSFHGQPWIGAKLTIVAVPEFDDEDPIQVKFDDIPKVTTSGPFTTPHFILNCTEAIGGTNDVSPSP